MLGKEANCPKFSRPLKIPAFRRISSVLPVDTVHGRIRELSSGQGLGGGAWRQGWSPALGPSSFLSPHPRVPVLRTRVGGAGEQKIAGPQRWARTPGREGRGSGEGLTCILRIFRSPHLGRRLSTFQVSPPCSLHPRGSLSRGWPPHLSHQRLPAASSLRLLPGGASAPTVGCREPSPLPVL